MDSMTAVSMFPRGVVRLILVLTGAGGVPLLLFVLHLDVAEAAPLALLAVGLSAGMGQQPQAYRMQSARAGTQHC
jgi:hypothetical protein